MHCTSVPRGIFVDKTRAQSTQGRLHTRAAADAAVVYLPLPVGTEAPLCTAFTNVSSWQLFDVPLLLLLEGGVVGPLHCAEPSCGVSSWAVSAGLQNSGLVASLIRLAWSAHLVGPTFWWHRLRGQTLTMTQLSDWQRLVLHARCCV